MFEQELIQKLKEEAANHYLQVALIKRRYFLRREISGGIDIT